MISAKIEIMTKSPLEDSQFLIPDRYDASYLRLLKSIKHGLLNYPVTNLTTWSKWNLTQRLKLLNETRNKFTKWGFELLIYPKEPNNLPKLIAYGGKETGKSMIVLSVLYFNNMLLIRKEELWLLTYLVPRLRS